MEAQRLTLLVTCLHPPLIISVILPAIDIKVVPDNNGLTISLDSSKRSIEGFLQLSQPQLVKFDGRGSDAWTAMRMQEINPAYFPVIWRRGKVAPRSQRKAAGESSRLKKSCLLAQKWIFYKRRVPRNAHALDTFLPTREVKARDEQEHHLGGGSRTAASVGGFKNCRIWVKSEGTHCRSTSVALTCPETKYEALITR